MADKSVALDVLSRLAAQPAVAFWESDAASVVTSALGESGIDHRADAYGNIIARVPGRERDAPPVALVAHLDHPGFEALRAEDGRLIAKALGGVPAASFQPGVPLQVLTGDGRRLVGVSDGKHGDDGDRQIRVRIGAPAPRRLPCPVIFDLPDFRLDGDLVRMRAADDLAGCAAILTALSDLSRLSPPGDVYGVFTRAEEVGLVGARLLAEAGTLPPETLVLSIESSKTLPGAEQGGGPVIRVGDAGLTFSADAEAALVRARETLQAGPGGFRCQRQLMSGGVCEASAFALYGYSASGIAFPLGNYHNSTPNGGVEAEYIHADDFMGGIRLITQAALEAPQRKDTAFRQRLREVPDEARERLKATGPSGGD